jgi:hypothetical protein
VSKPKIVALALLAALTLGVSAVEAALTGGSESYSAYDIAGSFLALLPLYWWYHLDKAERDYRAGPLMNVGMVAAVIVALPIYLVRSRGWKGGVRANAVAAVGLAALYLLEWLGEAAGKALYGWGT